MAQMLEKTQRILAEIDQVVKQVDEAQVDALCAAIAGAPRIFVHGLGRGGLVMRGFAMRLMHLGLPVHVVGDMTTPPITPGDLFVVNCAKGYVATIAALMEIALDARATVAMLTAQPQASLPQRSHLVVTIPAQTMVDAEGSRSVQPMGSVYEQALWVVCDAMVLELQERLHQGAAEMRPRHTNLE